MTDSPEVHSKLRSRVDPHAPTASRTGWTVRLLLLALGAAFALAVGYAHQAWRAYTRPTQETEVVLRGTSNVVHAVRDLANLETTSFHMERVIDLRERKSHLFGLLQVDDAILLVAAADIVAGIDLRDLREEDVVIDHETRRIRILLPPPRILSARLDNERTYVHTRSTDALAPRAEELETLARREAERRLRDAALEAGILQRARSTAERTVKGLLQSLGFAEVALSFRSE